MAGAVVPMWPESEVEAFLADREREGAEPWPAGDWGAGRLLAVEPVPRRFLVKDRLLANRAHLITGIGGSSKTRFQYQMAIGSVIGRLSWGWKFERTGKAVLLLAEDTEEDAILTLHAVCRSMKLDARERALVAANLYVITLAGRSAVLLERVEGTVLPNSNAAGFLTWLKALGGVVFVGIDPALAISNGNEGDPVHQRRLGEWIDQLAIEVDCCAMLATHAAKAVQSADTLLSHTSRGGGAITDAVRAEFVLRTMTNDEAKKAGLLTESDRARHVQLKATKGNAIPPEAFEPIWLQRDDTGTLHPADIDLTVGEEPAEQSPAAARETAAYESLWKLGEGRVVDRDDWQAALEAGGHIKAEGSQEARKKAMSRLIKALSERNLVVSAGRGKYAPRSTPLSPKQQSSTGDDQ
jgi:hypothetical protein